MNLAPPPSRLMTFEEFLELPQDDGIDRELIDGELRERPMTLRNSRHSKVEPQIAHRLLSWLDTIPKPRGEVHSGEAGFLLRRDPARFVGIDVAYVNDEQFRKITTPCPYYDVAPTLAVEVLSPSDTHEDIVEKITLYLEAGTVVWVVDPDLQTVSVYRPNHGPRMLNASEELSGDPYLPGFRAPVAAFFE
jgi:Uma2 family endonuclease